MSETVARKHCANYCNEDCLGVMMKASKKEGFAIKVQQWLNEDMDGRKCRSMVDNCTYFHHVVIPGIQNNL